MAKSEAETEMNHVDHVISLLKLFKALERDLH